MIGSCMHYQFTNRCTARCTWPTVCTENGVGYYEKGTLEKAVKKRVPGNTIYHLLCYTTLYTVYYAILLYTVLYLGYRDHMALSQLLVYPVTVYPISTITIAVVLLQYYTGRPNPTTPYTNYHPIKK